MKKQINLILIFTLIFILNINPVMAANVKANKNIVSEMSRGYLDIIDDIVDKYGVAKIELNDFDFNGNLDSKGLGFAQLIDFDNDGILELITIYNITGTYTDIVCQVWGFNGKDTYLIHDNKDMTDSDIPLRYPFMAVSANAGEIGITTVNDKPYLYYINSDGTGVEYWMNHSYYTFENNKWTRGLALGLNEYEDYDIDGNFIEEITFTRDDNEITEQEYKEKLSNFTKNAKAIVTDYEDSNMIGKFNINDIRNQLIKNTNTEPSNWAKEEIEAAKSLGLITENTSNSFRTDITRGQFAELVVNMVEKTLGKEINPADRNTFSDTEDLSILKAYNIGVVTGVKESLFAPNNDITREQIASMLHRAISYVENEKGEEYITKAYSVEKYKDRDKVSSYALESVGILAENAIMAGTSETTLSPKESATIEQSILLVYRIFNEVY